MIEYKSLGHINIVVDDINNAISYYEGLLQCVPKQIFRNFKNEGFSKSAGFLDEYQHVDVSICFLEVPGTGVFIELMQYHHPVGYKLKIDKRTNDIGGIGHICMKVNNIDDSFNHIKKCKETKLINMSEKYKPFFISQIDADDFTFFDDNIESNPREKEKVCGIIKNIRYFYFIDKYNIQWEF